MDVQASFTVFFEDPFWVGVYERRSGGQREAARLVFGAEPREYEVLARLLAEWHRLRFSPPVDETAGPRTIRNPKRAQREIHAFLSQRAASTKAQAALQLQREQAALERKTRARERREEKAEAKFLCRIEKKKQKHRGH